MDRAAAEPMPVPGAAPVILLPAVAWSYRFQRPQQLATALARCGHPVLYVDGFLRTFVQPERLLQTVAPGVGRLRVRVPGRPDPYRSVLTPDAAARLAEVIAGGVERPPQAVVAQLPFWGPLGEELRRRLDIPLVYDCLDHHAGFPGVPAAVAKAEERLLRSADRVIASSLPLLEHCRRHGADPTLLRNAVDVDDFPAAPRRSDGPPRIGYVGALGPWFDVPAVDFAAGAHPGWRFSLAGLVEDDGVAALGGRLNVELLGEIPYPTVAGFLAGLDVALIPFRDLPLTRSVDPVKLYEALAVGLPVVARELPELERWREPLVYRYREPAEFADRVERALAEDRPELRQRRRDAIRGETWDHRAGELLALCTRQHHGEPASR